jgi:hypothetical protein
VPNTFTVKSLKVSRSGVITVSLTGLRGPGTVDATIRASRIPSYSVRKAVGANQTLKFTATPSKKAKAKLKRGKLSARLAITYTPKGGKSRTVTKSVRL